MSDDDYDDRRRDKFRTERSDDRQGGDRRSGRGGGNDDDYFKVFEGYFESEINSERFAAGFFTSWEKKWKNLT